MARLIERRNNEQYRIEFTGFIMLEVERLPNTQRAGVVAAVACMLNSLEHCETTDKNGWPKSLLKSFSFTPEESEKTLFAEVCAMLSRAPYSRKTNSPEFSPDCVIEFPRDFIQRLPPEFLDEFF